MAVDDDDTTDDKWYGWKLPPLPPPQEGDTFPVSIKDGDNADVSCTVKVLTTPSGSTPGTVQIGNDSASAIATTSAGKITIPDTVTYQDKGYNLTYNVTAIGDGAFQGCTNLTGGITIPNNVTNIGDGAFGGCTGLVTITMLPERAPDLGTGAFPADINVEIHVPVDGVGYTADTWIEQRVVVDAIITASATADGSISPSGRVHVANGASQAFKITANSDYKIDAVQVDGANVGALANYTFFNGNTPKKHTISASFSAIGSGDGGSSSGGTTAHPTDTRKSRQSDSGGSQGGCPGGRQGQCNRNHHGQ